MLLFYKGWADCTSYRLLCTDCMYFQVTRDTVRYARIVCTSNDTWYRLLCTDCMFVLVVTPFAACDDCTSIDDAVLHRASSTVEAMVFEILTKGDFTCNDGDTGVLVALQGIDHGHTQFFTQGNKSCLNF